MIGVDGSGKRDLLPGKANDSSPAWNEPDDCVRGRLARGARSPAPRRSWRRRPGQNGKLAFRRVFNPAHTWGALFTASPDGSVVRQLTHPPRSVSDLEPDWSPDGKEIVFQRIDSNGCGSACETDEIDVVANDGSHLDDSPTTLLARVRKNGKTDGGICRSVPAWSPDGKQIAFQCQVQPSSTGDPGYSRICAMDADGSNLRQLPQTPPAGLSDGAPAWSSDGRQLAFDRGVRDEQAVFVMKADGSDARQLTAWALRAASRTGRPTGSESSSTRTYTGRRRSPPTSIRSIPTAPASSS